MSSVDKDINFVTLELQDDGTWTAICWDGLLRQMSSANARGRHTAYIEATSEARPVTATQELNKVEYGPVHDNGWRKEGVWINDGGYLGDDAIGDFWGAFYQKSGSDWRAIITYFVTKCDNGELPDDYGVEYQCMMFRDIGDGDQADLDIDYDYGDARAFETLEDAAKVAERCARHDESYIFMV